ncbi:hypothetical protein N7535_004695 [Penicillium sp. DV-2018c]|nr:hypothetical protein N7461_008277 [Penicillium sp. DV-2018c]KAJ5571035.1 hypothetical protein N7535_004695 [Penicillium sp. DV-2018c]
MSAPNAGRQSPDPERQSGAQQQDTPGTGKTRVGSHPEAGQAQKAAEQFKEHGLQSNPEHPLEKHQEEKFSKGQH